MHWLELLAAAMPGGPAARDRLDADLRPVLLERLGVDPHQGYMLVPDEEEFELRRAGGTTFVEALLVGPDAHGDPVTIAWDDAHAWWVALPAPPRAPPDLPTPDLPFAVRRSPLAWPDVWLELRLDRAALPGAAARLVRHLERWRAQRNRDGPGRVHSFSEPVSLEPHRLELYVDFGSAPEATLGQALAVIADAPVGAVIEEVLVRGYSAADRGATSGG